jgi:hypothetical protein
MEAGRRPSAHPGGYLVVLLGAIGFVGASFLLFYDIGTVAGLGRYDPSLFQVFTSFRESGFGSAGGYLTLFGGIATIAWISLVGLRSNPLWTRTAVLAVSIAWSLTWIGTFLGGWDIFTPRRAGYWALVLSVGVVLAGAIAVWRSAGTPAREPQMTSV